MQMDLILTEKTLCLKEHEYFFLYHRYFLGFISWGLFASSRTFIRYFLPLYSISELSHSFH